MVVRMVDRKAVYLVEMMVVMMVVMMVEMMVLSMVGMMDLLKDVKWVEKMEYKMVEMLVV